jgi:uncharacterized protein YndB with AHSA1/START domain
LTDKLIFTAFYPHPPERVWKALTDPGALGLWLLPNDFKPVVGHRFKFETADRLKGSAIEGLVTEVDEPKRIVYTWIDEDDGGAGQASRVSWSLRPKDGGTELRLEHRPAAYVEPVVLIEAQMNWQFAMYCSLPAILALLERGRPVRVPIVYVAEVPVSPEVEARRAGFRQVVEAK